MSAAPVPVFYYQTHDEQHQTWKVAPYTDYDEVIKTCAFHAGVYSLSKAPTGDDESDLKVRYKGSLVIDIDNKSVETGNINIAIDQSIVDVRAIRKYLDLLGVNAKQVGLYISGGKGFHIIIPLGLMGGIALNSLPHIHKKMAMTIKTRTGVESIDFSLFCKRKGKLLRTPNHKRAGNGNYKVQITWEEMDGLDAETYFNLCREPRPVFALEDPEIVPALSDMFQDALLDVRSEDEQSTLGKTDPKHFLELGDGEIPKCIKNLCSYQNIRENASSFNYAKMDVIRFLKNSNLTAEKQEGVIQEFCNNFHSDRHGSPQERLREVRSAERSLEGTGFDCSLAARQFSTNPCTGCPVKVSQVVELNESHKIVEIGNSYHRATVKKNEDGAISNFILTPIKVSYEVSEEGYTTDQVYTFRVDYLRKDLRPDLCTIKLESFLTKSTFSAAMRQLPQACWTGRDDDVSHLTTRVTSPESMLGVEKVMPVKKQGMSKVLDTNRGIDEWCWVQKGWSWNGRLPGTMEYRGPRQFGDTGEQMTAVLDMRKVLPVPTPATEKTLQALLSSRGLEELAIQLGWNAACWVKPQLQTGEYGDMFPVLLVYGDAGSGKSEMTKNFSILGGNDGINNATINISNSTGFFLQSEASSTTTVPKLFDEFNQAKMKPQDYLRLRDVIKSTGTKMAMGKGRVIGSGGNSQVATEITVCTAPIALLGTAQNQEEEIIQRSIILYLDKGDILNNPDTAFIEANRQVLKNKKDLIPYARMLLEKTLILTPEELFEMWEASAWVSDTVTDQRTAKAVRVIHIGLQLAYAAFKEAKCSNATLQLVERLLKEGLPAYMVNSRYNYLSNDGRSEIDHTLNHILLMATLDNGRGENYLREGVHFTTDEVAVHLKINSAYISFVRVAKDMQWMLEFTNAKAFIQALSGQSYYLGTGKARGVPTPHEWHTFSIQGLLDKHIDVRHLGAK